MHFIFSLFVKILNVSLFITLSDRAGSDSDDQSLKSKTSNKQSSNSKT